MLIVLSQLLCGLAWGYVVASLCESFFHRHILHANARFRQLWKRHPLIFGVCQSAYYTHHVIHHVRSFRQSFVTQFLDEQERQCVDAGIPEAYRRQVRAEKYGTTLTKIGALWYVAPSLPVFLVTFLVCGRWVTFGMAVPILLLYPWMSMVVHPFIHRRYKDAVAELSYPLSWFMSTRYMRFVIRHHYLHHQYIKCNYNLLIGADLLLGAHRSASAEDLEKMDLLGLPID